MVNLLRFELPRSSLTLLPLNFVINFKGQYHLSSAAILTALMVHKPTA